MNVTIAKNKKKRFRSMNFKQEEGEKRFASVYELVAQFKSFFFAATLIHLRMQIFT